MSKQYLVMTQTEDGLKILDDGLLTWHEAKNEIEEARSEFGGTY